MRNPYLQIDLVFTLILCLVGMSVLPMAASADPDTRILMCTTQGYQWVEVNQEPRLDADAEHCIFCLAADTEDKLVTSQAYAWYLDCLPEAEPGYNGQVSYSLKPVSRIRSRAPPIHV